MHTYIAEIIALKFEYHQLGGQSNSFSVRSQTIMNETLQKKVIILLIWF